MRYSAAEKLEILRLVEQSSLSVTRSLAQIGIPRSTFYAWYERYLTRGAGALEDGQPAPHRWPARSFGPIHKLVLVELASSVIGVEGGGLIASGAGGRLPSEECGLRVL